MVLFDSQQGKVLKVFSKNEAIDLKKQWVKIFVKDSQGARISQYLWHIFSFKRYDSIKGVEAEKSYNQQKASEFIIASDDFSQVIKTNALPIECKVLDYHVFPINMAWTMSFTHEDGYLDGPYFAKNPNYENLNQQNVEQIKKNKQIEIAKQKGWL